ncbi:MAG: glutathione S-transferase C-terminal domain-containing protein, partial [Pseudomonadota bacterium]|nr:glutathione S-transferase C-terminal domain-containing protein [Pseudomonadota bacterium]
WEALADGILDASVAARLEATWAGRAIGERSQAWIERQQVRIDAALKSISQGLGDKAYCVGTHFTLADIAVGCALGYLDFRFPANPWRTDYPNIVRLADKLAARQSFIDTAPPTA